MNKLDHLERDFLFRSARRLLPLNRYYRPRGFRKINDHIRAMLSTTKTYSNILLYSKAVTVAT